MNAPRDLPLTERPSAAPDVPHVQWLALAELSAPACTEAAENAGDPALPPPAAADHPLLGVRTRVEVKVGGLAISVGDLLATRRDDVLPLDRGVDDLVDLLVHGQVVARGQLVAVDDRFAIRIVEPPSPLAP